MNDTDKAKIREAKKDVEKCIRKYGLKAVSYIVNQRKAQDSLMRNLEEEKKKAADRIAEIERKLRARR